MMKRMSVQRKPQMIGNVNQLMLAARLLLGIAQKAGCRCVSAASLLSQQPQVFS